MRTRSLLLALACFVTAGFAFVGAGQELVTLTTPETKPPNPAYHVATLVIDLDAGLLAITLKGVNDEVVNCVYATNTTPTGAVLITGLNKANLASAYAGNATTGTLKQRIFHRLVVMNEAPSVCNGKSLAGVLAGTVP
jgi:hypothetical protein